MAEISIIVPIYNIKAYLPQCIESLLYQTFSDMEILLVDDGSTDGSGKICDEYAQKDSRIRVLHKKNGGLVSARKAGLSMAKGEYIAYVDGDDFIEPDMYERMYRTMKEQDVDVVMCGRYEDTGDVSRKVFHGIPEGRYGKEGLIRDVYPQMIAKEAFFEWGIFPSVWDKLFRRECLEQFQMEVDDRIVMGEDAACVYPCLLHAESIYILQECLYHYRQTVSSMVKKIPDCETEREQFRIFYQTINKSFERDIEIFDLRQQWKKYVLFLMVPRSDGLYKGYEELDYLFPFPKVKKGTDIILYGAGTYGQRLYRYLKRTGFCRVEAWVDQNYKQLQAMGLPVENPIVISDVPNAAIVIANTFEISRKKLYQELVTKYQREKIHLLNEKLVFSEETIQAFGLENESEN
ncbi:MAG: glycosyltransferase [Lachnospiraceae bacterium]|nr:glycosyltransferase [Lachnospiraceae bacterium]